MVQLGEFIFNEMLGPLSPFKILNSVDNSVELYTRNFKKRSSYEHARGEKFSCRCST